MTNPAIIGGVGTAIAVDALTGKNPEKVTTLTPEVWDNENKSEWEGNVNKDLPPTYSVTMKVDPYTTFTPEQLTACKGPGE